MRRLTILAGLCALLASAAPAGASEGAEVPWSTNIRQAFKDAGAANKPVFVDVWAIWCVPCKHMDDTTYRDPTVLAAMEQFVPLKVDNDVQETFCQKHDVGPLPLVLYLDGQGREIGRSEGLQTTEILLPSMRAVADGYPSYLEAAEKLNEPASAMLVADYLLQAGNPARASKIARTAMKKLKTPVEREPFELRQAQAQVALGDLTLAQPTLERLAGDATEADLRGKALEALVLVLRERGKQDEADAAFRRLEQEHPELAAELR